jgi:hypothetical protein
MSILALTSNTLIATAAAGNIEYTSPIFAATPIGTQRGIVPTQQYYRLNADYVGSNVNTAQSLFGVGVTLSASTVYEIEIVAYLPKTVGAVAHSIGLGFAGTATLNSISYNYVGTFAGAQLSANSTQTVGNVGSASNTTVTHSANGASLYWVFIAKGTVSINAGGTFIPQYTLSAAPGGAYSTAAGSFIRINPLSASGAATNVGTWA